MTDSEIKTRLNAILTTMNTISVSGIENMGKLVGCTGVLQDIVGAIELEEVKNEDTRTMELSKESGSE